MYRVRFVVCILLVLAFTMLYGCGEGKGPAWFKFGKPSLEKEPKTVEEVEGTVLASINGKVITLEDFDRRIEAFNREIEASKDIPDSTKTNYLIKTIEDKKRLLKSMVERELLIAEAISKGLDKDEDLVRVVEDLKEQLLFAKMIESEKVKITVTTREIEDFYNLNKDALIIPEERKISMVMLLNEDKAKEILIQLLQGGNFAALARANSSDKSASTGGDIGFIVKKTPFVQPEKKTMFKQFEEVAFSLELNKPSTVFKGPDGFYIIKVTDIKEAHQRPLSEIYNDIEGGLKLRKQEEALKTLVENLRKTGNITVNDGLLEY